MERNLLLLFFFCVVVQLACAQLPSLSDDGIKISTSDSVFSNKKTVESITKIESPKQRKTKNFSYLTWFMECNYVIIPSSKSSGAQLHFEFINRVKKKLAIKPSVGMGVSIFHHLYKQYNYGDYKTDITATRYSGHFTLGARLVHRLGGICLRTGYNVMFIQYKWKNFTGNVYSEPNQELKSDRLLHRIQFEAVGFKSFTKKKPGIGFLAGLQYLLDPVHKNSDLLIVKLGIAF